MHTQMSEPGRKRIQLLGQLYADLLPVLSMGHNLQEDIALQIFVTIT